MAVEVTVIMSLTLLLNFVVSNAKFDIVLQRFIVNLLVLVMIDESCLLFPRRMMRIWSEPPELVRLRGLEMVIVAAILRTVTC